MKYWFQILNNSNSLGLIFFLTFFITVMGLLSPIFIIHIFNRYIAFGLQGTLFFLLFGAFAVAVFEYVFRNIRNRIFSEILIAPIKIFKLDLMKKFFESELKQTNKKFFEIVDFNNNFFQFMSPKIQSSIFDAFFAILIIIILFFLDFLLATIFLVLIVIFLILQNSLLRKKSNYLKNLNLSTKDKTIIKELNLNQDLLKSSFAFNYSGFYLEKFLDKKLDIDSSVSKYDAQQVSITSFFILLSSICTIGIGSIFVVNGNLSIGSLIGFNIFATRALGTLSSAQNSFSILNKTENYLKDCNEFFEGSKNRFKGMQLSKMIGNIELKNLSFSYNKETTYIIKNFTGKFNSSEITVVTGRNGSGKSTLAKLLVGLLKPESGNISVDKTNLDKLSLVWYRNYISYLPQDVNLLDSSIMNNILISNPNLNEQEISRLLQNVGLDDDLKNSNLTITEMISSNFSNGILKKIHIARAISKNYQIYVLDDPTLYLDNDGRSIILKLIASLKRAGKTIICFSEDKGIIELSDRQIKIG